MMDISEFSLRDKRLPWLIVFIAVVVFAYFWFPGAFRKPVSVIPSGQIGKILSPLSDESRTKLKDFYLRLFIFGQDPELLSAVRTADPKGRFNETVEIKVSQSRESIVAEYENLFRQMKWRVENRLSNAQFTAIALGAPYRSLYVHAVKVDGGSRVILIYRYR